MHDARVCTGGAGKDKFITMNAAKFSWRAQETHEISLSHFSTELLVCAYLWLAVKARSGLVTETGDAAD